MLALLVFVGCGEPEPEVPDTPVRQPPPKKTAEQLYNDTMSRLTPNLRANAPKSAQLVEIVTEVNGKFRPPAEPNGEEAINRIKRELNSRIDNASRASQWQLVIAISNALDVFAKGPPERTGELKKIDRLRLRARAELSKPILKVKGFADDYVFLEITIPTTNTKYSEQVREGDSFLDDPQNPGQKLLRLEKIIGDNREVRIYYYQTDTSWTIPGPRG
jgi:hypothetical protein